MTVPAPLSDVEAARLADTQTEISPDTVVTGIGDGKLLGVAGGKVVGVSGDSSDSAIRFYSATITGDGQETDFIVTHNLNTEDLIVHVRDSAALATVLVDDALVDSNSVKILYSTAPAPGKSYRVNIIGLTEPSKTLWKDSQVWDDNQIWEG